MYVTLYRSVPNTLLLIRRGVLGVHLLRYFYSVSDRFHGHGGTSAVSELACQLHDITIRYASNALAVKLELVIRLLLKVSSCWAAIRWTASGLCPRLPFHSQ
jgi:hypothetical protein